MADKIQRILLQYEADVDQLKKDLRKAEDQLEDTSKKAKTEGDKISSTFKNVGKAIAAAFTVNALIQVTKELGAIAIEADGVRRGFKAAFGPGTLDELRKATRGTVSDLELMKKALAAKEFKIPGDLLAKGLAFARVQAVKLGKDVDFLSDSIVDGLGRKSALILDNLGIGQIELSEAVKETGDFYDAVGLIIERKMGQDAVFAVDTLADRMNRFNASVANAKLAITDFGLGVFEAFSRFELTGGGDFSGGILGAIRGMAQEAGEADRITELLSSDLQQLGRLVSVTEKEFGSLDEGMESANEKFSEFLRSIEGGAQTNQEAAARIANLKREWSALTGGGEGGEGGPIKAATSAVDDQRAAIEKLAATMNKDMLEDTMPALIAAWAFLGKEARETAAFIAEAEASIARGSASARDIQGTSAEPGVEADVEDDIDTKGFLEAADLALEKEKEMEEAIALLPDLALEASAAMAGSISGFATTLSGLLDESSSAGKAIFVLSKFAAIAEVLINLQRELSGIASNPILTALPDTGATIKTALSVAAGIRAAASVATITATTIQGFAEGTSDAPGGLSWVGEEGPELRMLPKGSAVFNKSASLDYREAIDAINAGDLEKYVFDNYMQPGLGAVAAAMKGESYTGDFFRLIQATRSNRTIELGPKTRRIMRREKAKRWH